MAESPLQVELRRRMMEGGFNQKTLARAAGLNETAVRDILKGRSKSPRINTLEAIARVLNCSVPQLTGGREAPKLQANTDTIDVIGAIEEGMSRQSLVRPVDDWYQVELPKDRRYRDRPRFALEVRGRGAERFYKRGDLVVCVKPEELNHMTAVGDKLVLQLAHDDGTFEFLIGEFQMDDEGEAWYWIGSGESGRISRSSTPGVDAVAVVVASYRQE